MSGLSTAAASKGMTCLKIEGENIEPEILYLVNLLSKCECVTFSSMREQSHRDRREGTLWGVLTTVQDLTGAGPEVGHILPASL